MFARVVPRGELKSTLARILSLLREPQHAREGEILPPLPVERPGAE
jgi:hypothetical protein